MKRQNIILRKNVSKIVYQFFPAVVLEIKKKLISFCLVKSSYKVIKIFLISHSSSKKCIDIPLIGVEFKQKLIPSKTKEDKSEQFS